MRKCIHGNTDRYANGRCAICTRLDSQKRYLANPSKQANNSKRWKTNHPDRVREMHRKSKLKANFGMTAEQYQEMFDNQNGCCAICGVHQDKLSRRLAVDHSHITGEIRGLLCIKCNTNLGIFENQELRNAFDNYLNNNNKKKGM